MPCSRPGQGGGLSVQVEVSHVSPLPGMTVMVFRARNTRKVLSAEMLPKSTNSVRYLGDRREIGAGFWVRTGGDGRAKIGALPGEECNMGLWAGHAPPTVPTGSCSDRTLLLGVGLARSHSPGWAYGMWLRMPPA